MPKTFHIGIKGLIINNNKALILKSLTKGSYYWDIPGGRIEKGETIINALERELQEELPSIKNIQVQNLVSIFELDRTFTTDQGLMLLIYRVAAELSAITLSNEHCQYQWVSKEELQLPEFKNYLNTEYHKLLNQLL